MHLILASLIALLAMAGSSQAATFLCAPIQGFAQMSRDIINPNTRNSYVLDGRGCVSVSNTSDIGYFVAQGFVDQTATIINISGSVSTSSVDSFGAVGDGATDDYLAFKRAMDACTAGGGGTILLGAKRYLIDSSNLTIPENCAISGMAWPGGSRGATASWSTAPFQIILNPTYTIRVSRNALINNLIVMRKGITALTTFATIRTHVAAFSGTGITCAGSDCRASYLMIGGFNQCFTSDGHERPYVDHVYCDATNGISIKDAHDVARIYDTSVFNFTTQNVTIGGVLVSAFRWNITAIADNGAGLYRLTLADNSAGVVPGQQIITGDRVFATHVGGIHPYGIGQINGPPLIATVIDNHTIDLQGTVVGGPQARTAAVVTSQTWITPTSIANIGVGQTVTQADAGTDIIQAGTTVVDVWQEKGIVYLSKPAQGTDAAKSLNFSDQSLIGINLATATLRLGSEYRSGTAYKIEASEGPHLVNAFEFGHAIGFNFTEGAVVTQCINCQSDDVASDLSTIGVLLDGATTGSGASQNSFVGGSITNKGTGVKTGGTILTTGGSAGVGNSVTNMWLNAMTGGKLLDFSGFASGLVMSGNRNVSGNGTAPAANIFVADSSVYLCLNGNFFQDSSIEYQTATSLAHMACSMDSTIALGTAASPAVLAPIGVPRVQQLVVTNNFNTNALSLNGPGTIGSGGPRIKLNNTTAGNPDPAKYIHVDSNGNLQILNDSETSQLTLFSTSTVLKLGPYTTSRGSIGGITQASSPFTIAGDAQTRTGITLSCKTTGSCLMTSDGIATHNGQNCVNIPDKTAYAMTVNIVVIDQANTAINGSWNNWPMILSRTNGGVATTALTPMATPQFIKNGATTTAIELGADRTNGCMNITFTTSNSTYRAVARIDATEIQGP